MSVASSAAPTTAGVVWHDAECGGYAADLGAWKRLARERGGPVVDLGAGTGRVALHLAARGHEVVAVDDDAALLAALGERAEARSLSVETIRADVRELDLGRRRFPLVIAPMQFVHLLGGAAGRGRAFAAIAGCMRPDAALALAVLHEPLPPSGTPEPLPDVREAGGWIHSSLPLAVEVDEDEIELVRLRQLVAPDGTLSEQRVSTVLDRLSLPRLERELAAAGLALQSASPIAATDEHVGSLLVVAEPAPGGADV